MVIETKLSKDADKLICIVYKEYLNRRKDGSSKKNAMVFDNFESLKQNLFSDWNKVDIPEVLAELSRSGFIKMYFGYVFKLNDDALIYMENRFPNGLAQVLDWIAKFKSVIPFV